MSQRLIDIKPEVIIPPPKNLKYYNEENEKFVLNHHAIEQCALKIDEILNYIFDEEQVLSKTKSDMYSEIELDLQNKDLNIKWQLRHIGPTLYNQMYAYNLPYEVLIDYLTVEPFTKVINDDESVFDQCQMIMAVNNNVVNICVQIPNISDQLKDPTVRKLINIRTIENRADEINEQLLHWFHGLCDSVQKQDEIGNMLCDYKEFANRFKKPESKFDKFYKKIFGDERLIWNYCYLDEVHKYGKIILKTLPSTISFDTFEKHIIDDEQNKKFYLKITDVNSKFYNCTMYIKKDPTIGSYNGRERYGGYIKFFVVLEK